MKLRTDDVFTTEVDGQTVLLDSRSTVYLTANAVGTFILGLLEDDLSEDDVVIRVAGAYDLTVDAVRDDCLRFLAALRAQDLLVD